jgi:hippurate hydrolase
VLASRIVTALQTLVSREIDPQDAAVVTGRQLPLRAPSTTSSRTKAKMLLTVRSYTDETRRILLDGIRRIVRGEAIAAGMPEDRMPVVTIREGEYTPATYNTEKLTTATAALFTQRFGADRVQRTSAVMGGEDFSRFHLADKSIESLIFWVGGVPQAQWDKAKGDPAKLPSLHSPFWAPDADRTIATATEAMTAAALGVLGKR